MKYDVEWGSIPPAKKAKYGGGLSLNSNKRKVQAYYVKDTPVKARKEYVCGCCARKIQAEETYCIRIKEYYMDRPVYRETFRLCKKCSIKT